jgi:hypothetical protein
MLFLLVMPLANTDHWMVLVLGGMMPGVWYHKAWEHKRPKAPWFVPIVITDPIACGLIGVFD